MESGYVLLHFEWRISPAYAGAGLIGKPVSTLAFAGACFSGTCARRAEGRQAVADLRALCLSAKLGVLGSRELVAEA